MKPGVSKLHVSKVLGIVKQIDPARSVKARTRDTTQLNT